MRTHILKKKPTVYVEETPFCWSEQDCDNIMI